MISSIRKLFSSKLGIALAMAFLALIAVAFASMDVSSSGTFGGLSGTSHAAVVGDERISTADLASAANSTLDNMRQQNPTLSMAVLVAQGGLTQVLNQLIDRAALRSFAQSIGLRAGDNLVNSEILRIPAFRGPNGQFSDSVYRQALAQQGVTDAQLREDISSGMLAQQVLVPAAFGAVSPAKLAMRYAALQKERRQGAIGFVPSAAFAPQAAPSASQLQAFYADNRDRFIRPERRVIRYATFDAKALAGQIEPTEAEIAAAYNSRRSEFAATEQRRFSQLIVPTQQAAQAIAQRGGSALAQAAGEAGLSVTTIGPLTREQLTAQANKAVADAAFTAGRGTIATPQRGALGWYVIRVDGVDARPARTLAQVRGELANSLRDDKRRRAIAETSVEIQDRFDNGEGLADVAREMKLDLRTTPPATANGALYGAAGTLPAELAPVLQTAFQMEEGEPQIAELTRGETFILFDVPTITASAAAPLAEIRDDVTQAWRLAEGSKAARAAADRILQRVAGGATLAAAMAAETTRLPAPEAVSMSREELAARNQQVPAPMALFFSMAAGTTKRLEAPGRAGWFLVELDTIAAGRIAENDPFLASAREAIGELMGREYAEQLRAAARREVGVQRNEAAVAAVRKQLTGEN